MDESELLRLSELRCAQGDTIRIAIMGGTFDPPHRGHIALHRACVAELEPDAVLYIPAAHPSFKRARPVSDIACRVDMLRLSLRSEKNCFISLREAERPGITYTVDTLEELRASYPCRVRFLFVMGADSLQTLPRWRNVLRILSLTEIVCAPRAGVDCEGAARTVCALDPQCRIHTLKTAIPDISSSQIRTCLMSGLDVSNYLDSQVEAYIRQHGLYGLRKV